MVLVPVSVLVAKTPGKMSIFHIAAPGFNPSCLLTCTQGGRKWVPAIYMGNSDSIPSTQLWPAQSWLLSANHVKSKTADARVLSPRCIC